MFSTALSFIYATYEATPGTYESSITASQAIEVMDPKISPEFQMTDQKLASGFHAVDPSVPGKRMAKLSFSIPIKTPSALNTDPSWLVLLEGCGLNNMTHTTTGISFWPDKSFDTRSLSMVFGMQQYGSTTALKVNLAGCMGNVKLVCDGVGSPLKFDFEFTGKINAWNDNTFVNDMGSSLSVGSNAVSQAATLTYNAVPMFVDKWEIDLGNKIEMAINPVDAAGYLHAYVASRRTTLKMDPAIYANSGIPTKLQAGTLAAFAFSSAGGNFDVSVPKLQLINHNVGDRAGVATYEIDALCVRDLADNTAHEVEFVQGAKA